MLVASCALAEDWTRFRGVDGNGVAQAENLPVTWDSHKNIVWKTNLPGLGTSSPIVLGSKVYVTCYSGYAESTDNPGDMQKLMRHVVCLDRKTGKILWSKQFKPKMPESVYKSGNSGRHGYASSTPTTDGERLYIFFGISGMYGLDLDGNVLWNTDLGSGTDSWGSAASPLLFEDLVIVNASVESKSLVALDKKTGKIVWRVPGIKKCWTTPILVEANGKQEIVFSMPHKVAGFDPRTGKELWHCEGMPDGYLCPSPVAHDGIVYVIGARKNTAMAVRAGGQGDVTETHVLWTTRKGSNVSSPVYLDGYLYWFHEMKGIVYCLDAKTGAVVYEGKLEPKPGLVYSSVTAADGKLYAVSQDNGTYVVQASPKFKQLAVNVFDDDHSRTNASIIVVDNQIIMRTDKAIYCIAKK